MRLAPATSEERLRLLTVCRCVMSGCVTAPLTDLKKPRVIMLFQTNKKEKTEIAAMLKMIMMETAGTEMENIDKLLLCINSSIFTSPNVRVCVQQHRVNTLGYKIMPLYVSFVIILYEAVNICIHCFC